MNKQKFIEFVENPESVSGKDADILAELAQNYPYSSLVHILLAKAKVNTGEARSSLADAALYIPDRRVLKTVMESKVAGAEVQEHKVTSEQPALVSEQAAVPVSGHESSAVQTETGHQESQTEKSGDVFQELQDNLQKLKDQRERFRDSGVASEKEGDLKDPGLQASPVSENEPVKNYAPSERLREVMENREEKTIVDPKRIEQINLIDDFIRNSQSIARKYRSVDELPEEQSDLTGKYHFTPPDLATENLALIMVRQGKPDKAIDIYEKLVLKYPEKKAYFASCIEKLKNS